jgi:hypothetical protein
LEKKSDIILLTVGKYVSKETERQIEYSNGLGMRKEAQGKGEK